MRFERKLQTDFGCGLKLWEEELAGCSLGIVDSFDRVARQAWLVFALGLRRFQGGLKIDEYASRVRDAHRVPNHAQGNLFVCLSLHRSLNARAHVALSSFGLCGLTGSYGRSDDIRRAFPQPESLQTKESD